ncbi:MAG: hypothetical protein K2J67_09645 [Lachnospiraceae bacterium]|nr:hypothetical protein [Lachnospiraceae bacterium]
MKHKNVVIVTGFCLLAGFLSHTTATAASQPMKAVPVVTQDFSPRITPDKGRIKTSAKAVSVKFRRCKYKLKTGQKKRICVTIRPSIATEKPVFASENPAIADFTNGNMLYAKQVGVTYITATLNNGRRARCKIVVKKQTNNNKEKQL